MSVDHAFALSTELPGHEGPSEPGTGTIGLDEIGTTGSRGAASEARGSLPGAPATTAERSGSAIASAAGSCCARPIVASADTAASSPETIVRTRSSSAAVGSVVSTPSHIAETDRAATASVGAGRARSRAWRRVGSASRMGGLRTNVIGFDDAPFERGHRGDVPLVGVVCARTRIDGILVSKIRRDGANATRAMVAMVEGSQFRAHVQAVLLQGIAVGGFNVVDVHALHEALGVPVIAIARKEPDREAMRRALFTRVPGAARKWRLLEQAGTMEPLRGVWVQRVGITRDHAREVLVATTLHGNLPEPLRVAHLFAGAMVTGRSRGGA